MSLHAGVVTAVVEEVDAALGRVRVEYRDMQESLLSPWAYIASPMSGKGRGALFMPERGDEVLVCYGDNDFSRPYVVGFLWNGEQVSPEKEAHNRVIVTPGGHQLRFEDKAGDKRVVLTSEGRLRIELDDAASKITVTDKQSQNYVTIEMSGTVRVQAATQVTVDAPKIYLTDGATHPVTFGDTLLQYLNSTLLPALQAHMHLPQFALGIFPVTPAPPATVFPAATPDVYSTRVTTG